ncbi:MAG TPA: DUF5996 family protein [Blastocatellia bacterium]|nr:DUF5996 family protein [Blastocatellia bacterium]
MPDHTRDVWPSLPLDEWRDTYATLHMWTQIVGKIRLVQAPLENHWWNTVLYVTSRGLTTSPTPYRDFTFQIDFDFIDHRLSIQTSTGAVEVVTLVARPVSEFYGELMGRLSSVGVAVTIHAKPDEVPNPIPFAEDQEHRSYDAACANRFWRILVQVDRVFKQFKSRFTGKCSPVQFFWGSFDLAVTRFSGNRAPDRPGADAITREAYSHECISAGFWPGGGPIDGPAFYSYTAPAPAGLDSQPIKPAAAYYSKEMGEYLLMYEAVRQSPSPHETLLQFLQSTYEAGATLAKWNRAELERA